MTRADVKDLQSVLRQSYEQGLSMRAVSEQLQMSKSTVSAYLVWRREAGLCTLPRMAPELQRKKVSLLGRRQGVARTLAANRAPPLGVFA